ncbi:MAG: hypothetical protein M1840_009168 [Geoglossum simile]|nr:MAG: hypothetical protein M1840_009168 [Geoglossum simile]
MDSHAAEQLWAGNLNQFQYQQYLMNNPSYYSPESGSLPTPPQTRDETSNAAPRPPLHMGAAHSLPIVGDAPQHDQPEPSPRGTGRTSVALAWQRNDVGLESHTRGRLPTPAHDSTAYCTVFGWPGNIFPNCATLGGAIFLTRANFKGFPISRPAPIVVPDPSTPLSASELTFSGRRSTTPSQYGDEAAAVAGHPAKRPRPDFSADVNMWIQASSSSPTSQPAPPGSNSPTTLAGFIELFFSLFHPAHPFVLPRTFLLKQLKQRRLGHLLSVIQFIGSCYAQTGQTEAYREVANQSLFNQQVRRDGFMVQALLLFAIGLHSCGERERVGQVLTIAIDMALELGMNRQEFSSNNGEGCRVLEESWRRTWWELYVIDGLLAAIHQKNSFRLYNIPTNVPLPCEEVDYFATGNIPNPVQLVEFDDAAFSNEEHIFSSFAYRVEAIRNVGRILAVGQRGGSEESDVDEADACLVNWALHLPESKRALVDRDGQVDEMLFQAYMIANASAIFLHRPRSHLAFPQHPDDTSCTPPRQFALPTKADGFHTAKTIGAADDLARLITLPTPIIRHTPFFTCAVTVASIVHLSSCSFLMTSDDARVAKERVRLSVGALKTMRDVWPVADTVLHQVKAVAREVYARKPSSQNSWDIATEEAIMRYLEDEQIQGLDEQCTDAYQELPLMAVGGT